MIGSWRQRATRLAHAVREQDPQTLTMFSISRLLSTVEARFLRYTQRPALSDFDEIGRVTTTSSHMAASLGCSESDFAFYLDEFEKGKSEAQGASTPTSHRYPAAYRSELNTQRLIYALIRACRPQAVLELAWPMVSQA